VLAEFPKGYGTAASKKDSDQYDGPDRKASVYRGVCGHLPEQIIDPIVASGMDTNEAQQQKIRQAHRESGYNELVSPAPHLSFLLRNPGNV